MKTIIIGGVDKRIDVIATDIRSKMKVNGHAEGGIALYTPWGDGPEDFVCPL